MIKRSVTKHNGNGTGLGRIRQPVEYSKNGLVGICQCPLDDDGSRVCGRAGGGCFHHLLHLKCVPRQIARKIRDL